MAEPFYKFKIGDRVIMNVAGEDFYPGFLAQRVLIVTKRHTNGTFDADTDDGYRSYRNLYCEYFDPEPELSVPDQDLFGALFGI